MGELQTSVSTIFGVLRANYIRGNYRVALDLAGAIRQYSSREGIKPPEKLEMMEQTSLVGRIMEILEEVDCLRADSSRNREIEILIDQANAYYSKIVWDGYKTTAETKIKEMMLKL